jgi:hypothetical protein
MKNEGRELYREFTGWAPWVHVLLWGSVGGSALLALASGSPAAAVIALASAALVHVVFGGLLVTVETRGVRVGLGRLRLLRTWIGFDEITELETARYNPLGDFGGWGLRGGKEKRMWSARGDRAVVLHLRDGRQVWIGSDEPNRLEGRIRNAMGSGGSTGDP